MNKVTVELFRKYRGPQDYLQVPIEELERDIHSTGFFRQKAKSIIGVSRSLVDDEEETIGSRCIGAPIRDQSGRVVAAVSFAGYKQQIHHETFQELIKNVRETAAAISSEFCQTAKL